MSKIKKILAISTMLILILPQMPVRAISYEVNAVLNRYEKITVVDKERFAISSEEELAIEESEEVIINREEKESYELLVPKTDANYEIALSYEDGNYVYVDNAESYDEAVSLAQTEVNEVNLMMTSEIIIPVVINALGETVYATESIGRVWKKYRYASELDRDVLSYVYTDSGMNTQYTYIHDGFISEVPIIQQNANEAKVLVSGYEGWMNMDITRDLTKSGHPNRDLIIQPITNVTNPSYYFVDDAGRLNHCISLSMDTLSTSTRSTTTTRIIGKAPSYLKSGQRYFSYDGNYFYDGINGTAATLRILTRDLQSGNHSNAVNVNNPYYNYYNYLPFRTKTNYTADEINGFINNHTDTTSKLRGLGQAFIDNQNKYGVNALLALGVAINESDWGRSKISKEKNNLFGINAVDNDAYNSASGFISPAACVEEFCKTLISKKYAEPSEWVYYGGFLGNKRSGANVKYASDPYWSEKAVSYAFIADYEMSQENINNMKDYNYYQLLKYSAASDVKNSSGEILYKVNPNIAPGDAAGAAVGGVVAMVASNVIDIAGKSSYEIYGERTTVMSTGTLGSTIDGIYDWKMKAYVDSTSLKFINEGKTNKYKEDIDLDGNFDIDDLAMLGLAYNKVEIDKDWKDRQDINNDGIIDIYDIVRLCKKL